MTAAWQNKSAAPGYVSECQQSDAADANADEDFAYRGHGFLDVLAFVQGYRATTSLEILASPPSSVRSVPTL